MQLDKKQFSGYLNVNGSLKSYHVTVIYSMRRAVNVRDVMYYWSCVQYYAINVDVLKDDANHDPQWTEDQILAAQITLAGVMITSVELDVLAKTTVAVFEILERAWTSQNCTLIDMKIEFGVDVLNSQSRIV